MRRYKYITFQDRRTLAAAYERGERAADIAERLGVTVATVYRELKRGESTDGSGTVILDRNQRKRNNIDRLSACPKVAGIPYSMYNFSLNLEHILHGRTNLSDWEKIRCAEEFDLKYGDDPDGFTLFMKESSFSVCDDYRSSWAFIKTELHSLERYSNFGIELPPLKNTTLQPNQ